MVTDELKELISRGESDQVEFKRSTGQRTEAAKTVCGMLNARGGFVFFGVADDGEVVGQQVTAGTDADIMHELARIEPRPLVSPEVIPVDEARSIVLLRVPEGSGGVYRFDGRPYIRRGATTGLMTQEEYEQRLLHHMHPRTRWETQEAFEFEVADLDHDEIVTTVEAAIANGRLADPGTREITALLRGLGLLRKGRLLNAAVVLFAKRDLLLPHYPQCVLRLARFRGVDKTEFVDQRQVMGNAFELLDDAGRFTRTYVPVAGRVVPDVFHRVDDPLYPPVALREALANALCHRDYASPGGSTNLAIYDDRLEVSNTGRLPFGWTVEDLLRPHISQSPNPVIAGVFYRRGIIEQWGRGTLKIVELTERAGLPRADFEIRGGEFVVRFKPTGYVPPSQVRHALTEFQQEILEILAREGGLSSDRLRPLLSREVKEWKILGELNNLAHLGLVRKIGVTRGVRWVVVT
jgi:ATP-dependent DNA helicase RecG